MTAATKSDRSGEGGGGGDVLPLAGLRVLNMAHVLAGPSCGWMLAMLGAEVVKVERPGSGDLLRIVDEDPARRSAGMGLGYQSVNAGKRSLAVDFKTAAGREIVLALADRADVLVQSFRAGALDALGLGPDDVVARNPRLVYCAISGFGQDGPRKGVRAFDHVIQAASGIMALTGEPDGGPQKVGTPGAGPTPLPNLSFKLDGQRPPPPPAVGADSRAIMAELGSTAAAIDALIADKVFGEPAESMRDAAA